MKCTLTPTLSGWRREAACPQGSSECVQPLLLCYVHQRHEGVCWGMWNIVTWPMAGQNVAINLNHWSATNWITLPSDISLSTYLILAILIFQTCVTIKELEFSALKALVDFVYTGYLDVNVTNVQSLFQASNLLQIHCKLYFCHDHYLYMLVCCSQKLSIHLKNNR